MSVVDSLKRLFSKKQAEADSSELSLATPDGSLMDAHAADPVSTTQAMDVLPAADDPSSMGPEDDSIAAEEGSAQELISVPLLGRRTIVTHQRLLFVLLAISLLVLGSVAFFAVNQADKVAQQVGGTGQSLMQSQRLAKSVSQALIGSPQAFPDVKEASDVLAKTVRALKAGDENLRIQPVAAELQDDLDKVVPMMERAEKN